MADSIDTTAAKLLACVTDKLKNEGRPVCDSYPTVGPPEVILCGCGCEVKDGNGDIVYSSGEATIHFEKTYLADPTTLQQIPLVVGCGKRGQWVADFSIVVTRCFPINNPEESRSITIPPDIYRDKSTDLHIDVQDIIAALTCKCNGYMLIVQEVAVDSMPDAGCSIIGVRVSVGVVA